MEIKRSKVLDLFWLLQFLSMTTTASTNKNTKCLSAGSIQRFGRNSSWRRSEMLIAMAMAPSICQSCGQSSIRFTITLVDVPWFGFMMSVFISLADCIDWDEWREKKKKELRKYLYRIISIGNILNHKLFFELDNCLPLLMMNKMIYIVGHWQWEEVEREAIVYMEWLCSF